jgi:hypothetical protein
VVGVAATLARNCSAVLPPGQEEVRHAGGVRQKHHGLADEGGAIRSEGGGGDGEAVEKRVG